MSGNIDPKGIGEGWEWQMQRVTIGKVRVAVTDITFADDTRPMSDWSAEVTAGGGGEFSDLVRPGQW